jgi:hypothetical protein
MDTSADLMARARRALESTAAVTLALAPLAMQPAQAVVLPAGDLVVQSSGVYFYNASGYFADWRGQPDGAALSTTNLDGSTKLSGTASATPAQFMAHKCHSTPEPGCDSYDDRGIAMVWSGTLNRPAALGDRLAISVDFSVQLPDTGGRWLIGARLAGYDLGSSNSLPTWGTSSADGSLGAAGSYRVHGALLTDELQDWQFEPGAPVYWQVFVAGVANAPWDEGAWSDVYGQYLTPYRGISLTVPDHSIDGTHVDASYLPGPLGLSVSAVPEPGSWLLMALGVGMLAVRGRRRD